jgi:hypothetical protein
VDAAETAARPLDMDLGETVVLAEGSYLHRCARCTGVWISSNRNPARCGKRACQQPAWRELTEPFRALRHEGVVVTPDMICKTRGTRRKRRS